jgi:hypothetical protein
MLLAFLFWVEFLHEKLFGSRVVVIVGRPKAEQVISGIPFRLHGFRTSDKKQVELVTEVLNLSEERLEVPFSLLP